jgi:hypothetical protein
MKTLILTLLFILILGYTTPGMLAEQKTRLGNNAALRYWTAFSEMQDWAITEEQTKQLNGILEGSVPYDDSHYGQLVKKNEFALELMARGTALANCDWGLDYELGDNTPVEYVRNALKLGRFNVLDAYHLASIGDKDGSAKALIMGLHFSRDVATGGSLFATIVAKDLLVEHFVAIESLQHMANFSPAQLTALRIAVAGLGPEGLDWESAMRLEMTILNRPEWQRNVPLKAVTQAYVVALQDPSTLPKLQQLLASVPLPLREVIPSPKTVVEQKQEFERNLQHIRGVLR